MKIEHNIYKYHNVSNVIIDDDKIWFTSGWCNFLFSADKSTGEINFAKRIPVGGALMSGSVSCLFEKGKYIYIIMNRLEDNIVRFNVINNEFDIINSRIPKSYFSLATDEDNIHILLPMWNLKQLIVLNEGDLSYRKLEFPLCKGSGIQMIQKYDQGFALVENGTDDLVLLDGGLNEIKRISDKPKDYQSFCDKAYSVYGLEIYEDMVYIFPGNSNSLYSVNLSDNRIQEKTRFTLNSQVIPTFSCVRKIGDHIWSFCNASNSWKIYDMDLNVVKEYKMHFAGNVIEELKNAKYSDDIKPGNSILLGEDEFRPLRDFINTI